MTYSFAAMQKHMPDHGCCNLGDDVKFEVPIEHSMMHGYARADTETTQKLNNSDEEDRQKTITININVNGTVDPNKLAKDITELIEKEGRTRGN